MQGTQALAETANRVPMTKKCSPRLPDSLAPLLRDDHQPRSVTGFLPSSGYLPPACLDERQKSDLGDALVTIETSLIPATNDELLRSLGSLVAVCRMEDRRESEWAVVFEVFAEDLADYPPDIIAETCRKWRREQKFFPTIAEFLGLAKPLLSARLKIRNRLMMLKKVSESPAPNGDVTIEWCRKIFEATNG